MCIITGINESNYEYYKPFMPDVLLEWIRDDEDLLVFGIESFDMAAGSVIIRRVYPEAQIVWFYVSEHLRGRGIGTDALMNIMELMREGYGMSTLSIDFYAGTDEELIRLFDGYPVRKEKLFQTTYETSLGWMLSSNKFKGTSKHSRSLMELDNKSVRNLNENLIRHGFDLVRMPINPGDYLGEQSAVYMEDEQAKGVLLVRQENEGVEISLLASFANNVAAVMDMINFTAEKMNRFSEETRVIMNVVDDRISKLIRNLNSMEEDDNEGFSESERFIVDLSIIDVAKSEAEMLMNAWKDLEIGRALAV